MLGVEWIAGAGPVYVQPGGGVRPRSTRRVVATVLVLMIAVVVIAAII
jgi:hypothetical protein